MRRREFVAGSLLSALVPLVGGGRVMASSVSGRLLPVPLNPGDTVALLSPSSPVSDSLDLQLAREVLEALGFQVKPGAHYGDRRGHLAGADAGRADDVNRAFADPEVRAVVCVRGGSGGARLLPLLDYEVIRANPKALLGYSDITALHCAIQARTGLVTFHGPNGSGSWNSFNAGQFRRMFFERELMEFSNPRERGDELVQRRNRTITITGGRARGELVGGNLT